MLAFDNNAEQDNHAEEEENYFVSMTDMMVGILFIFIIMLMVFALQFQKQTDISQDRVQKVAEELQKLRQSVKDELDNLEQAQSQRAALLTELERELDAVGLKVQIDAENGVLRLTENAIRFASDSSTINDLARENVRKLSSVLAAVLPRYTSCNDQSGVLHCQNLKNGAAVDTVFIEGHTDDTGIDERNWQLSTERAVQTYRTIAEFEGSLRKLKTAGKTKFCLYQVIRRRDQSQLKRRRLKMHQITEHAIAVSICVLLWKSIILHGCGKFSDLPIR